MIKRNEMKQMVQTFFDIMNEHKWADASSCWGMYVISPTQMIVEINLWKGFFITQEELREIADKIDPECKVSLGVPQGGLFIKMEIEIEDWDENFR